MSLLQRFLPNKQFAAALNANNPSAANPFATMADVIGINIVTVPNYSALPAPATAVNKYYRTLVGENTSWRPAWLGGTYYPEGIYFSDGLTWDFVGEFPYQADQAEVDAGVNDKNFVTPLTLENAAKWNSKFDNPTGAITDYLDGTGAPQAFPTLPSPGGGVNSVQYNNSGSFSGAANVAIHGDDLLISVNETPSAPTSGLKVHSISIANRLLFSVKGPSGIQTSLQNNLYRNGVYMAKPAGNSTTVSFIGGVALTATGTATASSVAVTNLHTQMKRVDYRVTTPATTAVAGFRANTQQFFRGTTSTEGGFFFVGRWGPATGVSTLTSRASFGMHANQSAPTDVEPSSVIDQLAMGWDAADTNIQFMHNSGSGTATKIDLGGSFPVPTLDRSSVYELAILCIAGGFDVYYQITDLITGSTVNGTVNSDIPSTTTLMHLKGWVSVGGTSSVAGIALMSTYIETDN